MDLKTSFLGFDMEEVLKRFESFSRLLEKLENRQVSKETALDLCDEIIEKPIKKRLTGFNKKQVNSIFADFRIQLMKWEPEQEEKEIPTEDPSEMTW